MSQGEWRYFSIIIIGTKSRVYSIYLVGMLVECENNDIRLQNGLISTQVGRVEVCSNRKWHLVCDNMWDDRDAAVVCNQLGFGGESGE